MQIYYVARFSISYRENILMRVTLYSKNIFSFEYSFQQTTFRVVLSLIRRMQGLDIRLSLPEGERRTQAPTIGLFTCK